MYNGKQQLESCLWRWEAICPILIGCEETSLVRPTVRPQTQSTSCSLWVRLCSDLSSLLHHTPLLSLPRGSEGKYSRWPEDTSPDKNLNYISKPGITLCLKVSEWSTASQTIGSDRKWGKREAGMTCSKGRCQVSNRDVIRSSVS